jgi:L-ascorbate metabolism protein UlaG (beta-lactamase superfamily)
MIQLSYYGHACFGIKYQDINILFDPFITGNALAKEIKLEDIRADYIFLSHGHGDHIADTHTIEKSNDATIVACPEICNWYEAKGHDKVHPINMGGDWNFKSFRVKCVSAAHSSSMPDGSYGGNPLGFIIYCGEKCFYYSGDTALTLDMQLIPKYWAKLDFAILPIGNNFTMGIDDALIAADFIACKNIVGVHYDTFGMIKINHEEAFRKFIAAGKTLLLPPIGAHLEF